MLNYRSWSDISPSGSSVLNWSNFRFLAVATYDGLHVIIVGAEGTVFYTSDYNTEGWKRSISASQVAGRADLVCVSMANALIALVGGTSGTLVYTYDGGVNWRSLTDSFIDFNLIGISQRFTSISMISTTVSGFLSRIGR